MKLLVSAKNPHAISSPNCMHRDGETFTFAHLFTRHNVTGGINYIAESEWANYTLSNIPCDNIKAKFELHETFETYAVYDKLVSHYISPIELENEALRFGCREIILLDFSMMKQHLI